MDADLVSHMMHYKHLITDDDYEAIIAAPNDNKMNTVILQYIKEMDINKLNSFCDALKNIETQKIIGDFLSTCKCINYFIYILYVASYCREKPWQWKLNDTVC